METSLMPTIGKLITFFFHNYTCPRFEVFNLLSAFGRLLAILRIYVFA